MQRADIAASLTPVGAAKALLLALLALAWWRAWHSQGPGLPLGIVWSFATVLGFVGLSRLQRRSRARYIESAPLPRHLRAEVRVRYPQLSDAQLEDIERGLRQFFQCHLRSKRVVAMPSQAVDALWHAFILDTRAYARFCVAAFGGFLHHRPAQALGRDAARNDSLRRCWFHACRLERIDPRAPARLPLLFALDAQLAIPDGYRYLPDCGAIDRAAGRHCGADFGTQGSAAGDAQGFGGEAGGPSGSDGGSDGGGDGGGGD